jgi:PKD repeat protein
MEPPTDEQMAMIAKAYALGCNLKTGAGGPGGPGGTGGPGGGGAGGQQPGGGKCSGRSDGGDVDRSGRKCVISPSKAEARLGCGGEANFSLELFRFNGSESVEPDCGGGQASDAVRDGDKMMFSCTYDKAGTYTVTATADGLNCGRASADVKPVGLAPVADFDWAPQGPLPRTNVTFNANRSWDQDGEGIKRYYWDFNSDGTVDVESESWVVMHSFERGGRHDVTLTVEDTECQRNSTTKTVEVVIPINVRVVSATDEGTGQRVCFAVDVPEGYEVVYFETDFGDGFVSKREYIPQEVCHFYMPGKYHVRAGVEFSDGTFSTAGLDLSVTVGLCPPIPSFKYYPDVPGAGEVVYFDASGSVDLDGGYIASYSWSFGDGTIETASSSSIEHIYSLPGTYVVKLSVTDDDGQTNSISRTVVVTAYSVDLIILNITPREHAVDVEFGVHIPAGAELDLMELDYGDESEHLTLNTLQGKFVHAYQASGTYTAILRVTFTNGMGGEDSETLAVAVLSEGIWLFVKEKKDGYGAGEELTGEVEVLYSRPIPSTSLMRALIDGEQKDEIGLNTYLTEIGPDDYKQHRFKYRVTAAGETRRLNDAGEGFSYTIKSNGTCGGSQCSGTGCDCSCSPPYPCYWEAEYSGSSTVSPTEGLKFVYNGADSITLPADANEDTKWSEIGNSNGNVETTMRVACGGESYEGHETDDNGWVHRAIAQRELAGVPGTSDREAYIERFDGSSLFPPRRFGEQGGVYKNGEYREYGIGSSWDGDREGRGYVRIINYDAAASYEIVYLPPSGSRLCAYTLASVEDSEPWERSFEEEHLVRYGSPFSKTYTEGELGSLLEIPNCPAGSGCQVNVHSYTTAKTEDSDNAVTLTSSRNVSGRTLTVNAIALLPMLKENHTFTVDFANFRNLAAPQQIGVHTLSFAIVDENDTLATGSDLFVTCVDADGDGYCAGNMAGMDCNDMDADVHPGAAEKCNGIDDDCDWEVDEDFWGSGNLGNECGKGICFGYYVCGSGGLGEACNSTFRPGDSAEICDNFLDDDCDGVTDEPDCSCPEGLTVACGTDGGECKAGVKVCEFGSWSACKGEVKGKEEVCNRRDDDCDGVIDNVGGGKSAEAAACGCFKGAPPREERCNGLDDDCDGRIDESLVCCEAGETRSCSDELGACAEGVQKCVEGRWGPCSVEPALEETCHNGLDDDCDGEVDEGCPGQAADKGGESLMWYIIAGLAVAVASGIGILYLTGRF